jgi:hypothetical protein
MTTVYWNRVADFGQARNWQGIRVQVYLYRCTACGNEAIHYAGQLAYGTVKACPCLRKPVTR